MAIKVDLVVAGQGVGVHAAAIAAAKVGLSVGWISNSTVAAPIDSTGLIISAAIESVEKQFASEAPGIAKVAAHRLVLLGDGAGTTVDFRSDARLKKPETYLVERVGFENWLAGAAAKHGVKKLNAGRITEMMNGDNGQVQGIRTSNDEIIRCRAVVIGQGAEYPIRDVLQAAINPEERIRATAVARIAMDPVKLATALGIEAGEGVYGRIVGNLAGGMPAAGWMTATGGTVQVCVNVVVSFHTPDPAGVAKKTLTSVLESAAMRPLLRGITAPSIQTACGPISGYKYVAPLHGNGWVLVGPSTRLGDPLRHETAHVEAICGSLAANAIDRAIRAGDTSQRAMSVYRGMLDDTFVMADLKNQRNNVEDIERDPTVLSYYPQFLNRMFEHDTSGALAPRRERNREFFRNLRNERPVWEFAMGLRKSLKLMRD